ncbi:uracil-DNA glycosylase [Hydrogenophaga sp.]|uniref:uracil-DNA glycosylase n=1 Tax=Hydrogenophaga sp. TaxID=1904254 RepID=UPI003AF8CF5E
MTEAFSASSSAMALAQELASLLPATREGLFNPYATVHPMDAAANTPMAKLGRLGAHLDCDPEVILVGEAPGWRGCALSGVAFTSEDQLLSGAIPRVARLPERLSTNAGGPFKEATAEAVWGILYELGLAERAVLWNAIQMHPHQPDNALCNRTPTTSEVLEGKPAMLALRSAFPKAKLVAVGKKSQGLLARMGLACDLSVRHPSFGGKPEFQAAMRSAFGRNAPMN